MHYAIRRYLRYNKTSVRIYGLVLAVIATCFIFWRQTHASIWENLLAGSIEIGITVGIIDTLLRTERATKLKQVNMVSITRVEAAASEALARLADTIGYTLPLAHKSSGIHFDSRVRGLLDSQAYKAYLARLEAASPRADTAMQQLIATLRTNNGAILRALQGIRPYPKPLILHHYAVGNLEVIDALEQRRDPNQRPTKNNAVRRAAWHIGKAGIPKSSTESLLWWLIIQYAYIYDDAWDNNLHFDL